MCAGAAMGTFKGTLAGRSCGGAGALGGLTGGCTRRALVCSISLAPGKKEIKVAVRQALDDNFHLYFRKKPFLLSGFFFSFP